MRQNDSKMINLLKSNEKVLVQHVKLFKFKKIDNVKKYKRLKCTCKYRKIF